jgi:hypothetical protein
MRWWSGFGLWPMSQAQLIHLHSISGCLFHFQHTGVALGAYVIVMRPRGASMSQDAARMLPRQGHQSTIELPVIEIAT